MPADRPVTLKHVARAAKVSVMTVSRVLRKQANISPHTRALVEKVAVQLGYRPHPLVSALMSYRRARRAPRERLTLAFITRFGTCDGWKSARINQDFYEGAVAGADQHGYKLETFWMNEPGMTAKRLSVILYHRNVNGLIVAPLPMALGHMRLEWERFSAVALGYSLARPQLHRAVNHQFRSMRLAMRQLRKLGHRRVGLALRTSIDERVDHQWVGSFLVEQMRVPEKERTPLFVVPDRDWNEKNFARWFKQNRPSTIVSQHEEVLDWLEKTGASVPDEVGFAHLNCPDKSGRFAGIYQNGPAVGAVAVDFLVSMVQRNEKGIPDLAHSILVEGTWQNGATLNQKPLRG